MKSKLSDYKVSSGLQKTFVWLALAAYVINAAMNALVLTQAYPSGPRVSPFTVAMLQDILLPVILFCLAYFTNRSPASRLWRAFEAALLLYVASLAGATLASLYTLLGSPLSSDLVTGAFYQSFPGIAVLAAFIGLLVWRRRNRKMQKTAVPTPLQKLFVLFALTAYGINLVVLLGNIISQLPHNQNLSGFYPPLLGTLALPILLFALAYYRASEKPGRLHKLFSSTLYSLMGLLLFSILTQAASFSSLLITVAGSMQTDWHWLGIEVGNLMLTTLLYVVALWRNSKPA